MIPLAEIIIHPPEVISAHGLQMLIRGLQSHDIMDILEFCFQLVMLEENFDVKSDFVVKAINIMRDLAAAG